MSKNPPTPKELVDHLKKLRFSPQVQEQPSDDFINIHIDQLKELNAEHINPNDFFDQHFSSLLELIAKILPDEKKKDLINHVAVGCAENSKANASIITSGVGLCAIIVNQALLSLLNHFAKLIAAARHPECVIYCEGIPTEKLDKSDYVKMSVSMLQGYGTTGKAIAPQLKFKTNSIAIKEVETHLFNTHLFLLTHEVGHYLNGDLDKEENLRSCNMEPGMSIFGETISHKREYRADSTGFELYLRVVANVSPDQKATRALDNSAVQLFNFLREINDRGCDTHPRSSERLVALTNTFFGDEASDLMRRSFNDLSYIDKYRSSIGNITVSDVLSKFP